MRTVLPLRFSSASITDKFDYQRATHERKFVQRARSRLRLAVKQGSETTSPDRVAVDERSEATANVELRWAVGRGVA